MVFKFFKKYFLEILLVLLVGCLAASFHSSCGDSGQLVRDNAALKKEIALHEAEITTLKTSALKAIERSLAAEEENRRLVAESQEAATTMAENASAIAQLEGEEVFLKDNFAALEINLRAQISQWRSQFSLAIEDRDRWKTVAEDRLITIEDLRRGVLDAVAAAEKERGLKLVFSELYKHEKKRHTSLKTKMIVGAVALGGAFVLAR